MISHAWYDPITGTFYFLAAVAFFGLTLIEAGTKLKAWFSRFSQRPSTHVDATLNQMFVQMPDSPYAGTRSAREHITKGGRNA